MTPHPRPPLRRQRGIVLVVALIMLLLMTMAGLASMRGTTLEERMAGNWRDQNLAFQGAEAALRHGENTLAPLVEPPVHHTWPACTEGETCLVFVHAADADGPVRGGILSALEAERAQWFALSRTYPGELGLAAAPSHLIEHRAHEPDHLVTGFGPSHETGRDLYRITAHGRGQTPAAESILQSIYAKRFN